MTGIWRNSGLHFAGYGHYYPQTTVENDTAEAVHGNEIDREVLGTISVRTRGLADETETSAAMAVRAAQRALADARRTPAEVDLLVLGNWTERQHIPELAPGVAHELGATSALAFDVCGACTGFVHGVQTAAALMAAQPGWSTAVVVCSERFSLRARPGSKGALVAGDAAGAVVLARGRAGLLDSVLTSDGSHAETVQAPNGWIRSTSELAKVAAASLVDVSLDVLERNGLKMSDVDWVVPHPGTDVVHNAVRERLEIPPERFLTNFETRGNTGAASIPIVLSELREKFSPGDLILSPAVGSGWFSGALLFEF